MESIKNINITGSFQLIFTMIRYNLKIVFGGKFIYFLLAGLAFYLFIMGQALFSSWSQDTGDIYNLLLFPALLSVFYPVMYNIQNDKNSRMLEIIFSIPNYRYKIYLARFVITLLLMAVFVLFLAVLTWFSVIRIPVFPVVYQLFYPLLFLSCLSFLFTTITYNGNTAAVIMIIIGLVFFVMSQNLEASKWNIFLNPFSTPERMNPAIWPAIVKQNRIILLIGSAISLLWGLMNLQKRERFV